MIDFILAGAIVACEVLPVMGLTYLYYKRGMKQARKQNKVVRKYDGRSIDLSA